MDFEYFAPQSTKTTLICGTELLNVFALSRVPTDWSPVIFHNLSLVLHGLARYAKKTGTSQEYLVNLIPRVFVIIVLIFDADQKDCRLWERAGYRVG